MNSPNFHRLIQLSSTTWELLFQFTARKRLVFSLKTADQSLKFIHVAAIEQKQLFEMMSCFVVTQVEISGSPPS